MSALGGLQVRQEDAFSVNGAELVLYQLPALRGFGAPAAPSVGELREQYARTCAAAAA